MNPWGGDAVMALPSYAESGRHLGFHASTSVSHGIQMALEMCDLGLHNFFSQDNFQRRPTAKGYMPVALQKYEGISSLSLTGDLDKALQYPLQKKKKVLVFRTICYNI